MMTILIMWLAGMIIVVIMVATAKEMPDDYGEDAKEGTYYLQEPVDIIQELPPLLDKKRFYIEIVKTSKRKVVFESEITPEPTGNKPDNKIYFLALRNLSNQIKRLITR